MKKHRFVPAALFLFLAACTGDVVGTTATLRSTTRVPADDGARDVVVGADSLTIYFDGEPPAYAAGDVVLGSEGPGYLRRVVSLEREAHKLVLHTESAELGDAFDELLVNERVAVVPDQAAAVIVPTFRRQDVVIGGKTFSAEIQHDAPVAAATRSLTASFVWEFPRLSITLTDPDGHVALQLSADKLRVEKQLTLDVHVDFGFFTMKEMHFITEDSSRTTIEGLSLVATGSLPVAETSITVFDAPALAVVPVGPLVFTVGASVELGASLGLAAAAEVHTTSGMGYDSWRRQGVTWDGEFHVIDEREISADADFGELESSVTPLEVDAAVFVVGALRFALYGVIGPEIYARVTPLAAHLTFGSDAVDGTLSAAASAGARFRFPFFKLAALNVTFASWSQQYASFHQEY